MPRSYSVRSSYPLARSSQNRRRLILLHHLGQPAAEQSEPSPPEELSLAEEWDELEEHEPPSPLQPFAPPGFEEAGDSERTLDADELRRLYPGPPDVAASPIDNLADAIEFADEIFNASQARNEQLQSGAVSESVLDEEEGDVADAESAAGEESLISSALGDESIILSGRDEESRPFSLRERDEPADDELPGSATTDRKPHYPSWYVPSFRTVKRLLEADKPVTWLFAGESNTPAVDHAQGRRNFTEHFSERIRMEMGRMLDVVINTGDVSETCASLLKNLEWRVLRFHPEVVSILLGRNDAARGAAGRESFQQGLEQIIQGVRESGALLVLHVPNRVDPSKAAHLADLRNYVRIVREAARNFSIPLIDHWEHWKQRKPDPEALRPWLAADGIQPGVFGHREMAKLIFQRFEIFDPNSPICTARVP